MLHRAASRLGLQALLVLSLSLWSGAGRADTLVQISHMSYDAARHSVVLDITGPVTISTRSLGHPPRLVVDVPQATLVSPNRELRVHDPLVKRVRVSQFQIVPPVVRIVIETAGTAEPIIAVQQTATKLYITVAPPHAAGESPAASSMPTPRPTAHPKATKWHPKPHHTPKPLVLPSLPPVVLPSGSPAASPLVAPSIQPTEMPLPLPTPSAPPTELPLAVPSVQATETPVPAPRATSYWPVPGAHPTPSAEPTPMILPAPTPTPGGMGESGHETVPGAP